MPDDRRYEWQNRPLEAIYPVAFFDGIVFNSRKDNIIVTKCVYSVHGINMEGQKEILGTWISENESASFYASVCADLKNRGVKDIFIAFHDNLTGLCDAIDSVLPKTKNQLCIAHDLCGRAKPAFKHISSDSQQLQVRTVQRPQGSLR